MCADTMTPAQLLQYHTTRWDEAIRQALALPLWAPEAVGRMVDALAAYHAREAAHQALAR